MQSGVVDLASRKKIKQWPIENIPNSAHLFMRVHKMWIQNDKIVSPGVFQNHENGMSTDWNKYSTPQETLKRVSSYGKDPNNYGVIHLNVGQVRDIPTQSVTHVPLPDNRSHTNVCGEKDTEARVKFGRIYDWIILYKK